MIHARSALFAIGVFTGVLSATLEASAFCRTKACDTNASYGDVWDVEPDPAQCVRDNFGCFIAGTPLHWPSNCLSFGVQQRGSPKTSIDLETARNVIAASFQSWADVDCGGGATPSFAIDDKGPIACDRTEYNQDQPNANVFVFRDDDWPYSNRHNLGGDGILALTTITYNVENADIYDADVEINTDGNKFSTTETPPSDAADLAAVITHEIGHFLGLSHSSLQDATMRGTGYELGTTGLRTLALDDIEGICSIFPPGNAVSRECDPRHGFSSECGSPDEGCALGGPGGGSAPGQLWVFAALALAWGARRGRGQRRSRRG